jgi:signal transduction histidine kinase
MMKTKLGQLTWRQWLMPRSIDGIGLLLYLGVLGVYSYYTLTGFYSSPYPAVRISIVFVALLALVLLDRLEYLYYGDKLSWRQGTLLMTARPLLIALVSLTDGLGYNGTDFFILLSIFGLFLLIGNSYSLSGGVWLLYLIARVESVSKLPRVYEHEGDLLFHLILFIGVFFIFYIAYLIRQERLSRMRAEKLLAELEQSHRQLQAYATQAAELATTEERNRLARDIHDSLGHYLTVINVQLEKALAFRERKPEEADQAVRDSKRLASEALQEVRRSVGALRSSSEPFSLAAALTGLVNNLRRSRLVIELEIEGCEDSFSKPALQALYRAAQEGLTNIQKHAQASRAVVRVRLTEQEASLYISDNGQGFDPAAVTTINGNPHYGLRGVRERLELIHGTLKLDSAPGQGTRLLITIPNKPL